jgi:hypothetical protein
MHTSKLCFVGNSHLGALAQANEGNSKLAEAGYDVAYWGAAGSHFPKIRYEAGYLISPNEDRARTISGGGMESYQLWSFLQSFFSVAILIFSQCQSVLRYKLRHFQ